MLCNCCSGFRFVSLIPRCRILPRLYTVMSQTWLNELKLCNTYRWQNSSKIKKAYTRFRSIPMSVALCRSLGGDPLPPSTVTGRSNPISVCLSVCLSTAYVCLSVCLSVCPLSVSACLSVFLFVCPFPDVFPPLPLSALSSSPFHCALQDGFCQTWWTGKHDHTTAIWVSLRPSGGLRVVQLPAGSCLLDLYPPPVCILIYWNHFVCHPVRVSGFVQKISAEPLDHFQPNLLWCCITTSRCVK